MDNHFDAHFECQFESEGNSGSAGITQKNADNLAGVPPEYHNDPDLYWAI
jgi:hypothetical protein